MSRAAPGSLVACAAVVACGGSIPPPSPAVGPTTAATPAAAATPPGRSGGSSRHRELPPWQRVRAALEVDPLEYVHGLGQLSSNARPSSLQPLLKRRQHALSSLCEPILDLSGLQWRGLQTDRSGGLTPPPGVASFSLVLGSVAGVPGAGVKERKCWLSVARLCLYDGARFHGNVQAVKPREVRPGKKPGADTWVFDSEPLLVRCPAALVPRASVYIELNVSYELTPEEQGRLPAKPERAAKQVDEITVAWTLVELRSLLPQLTGAKSLNVPLRGGPLAQRLTLRQCAMLEMQRAAAGQPAGAQQQQAAQRPILGGKDPTLGVKLSAALQQEQAVAAALPECAVVSPAVAKMLGLYRQLLVEGLGCGEGAGACVEPVSDVALAALPAIVDDPDLCHALFQLWEQQTAPLMAPGSGELKRALRRCVALLWAMMGSQAIPAPSIANHASHQWSRKQRMVEYLAGHPVAALNSNAHSWLHTPFCASELACDPLRGLGVTV